MQVANFKIKQKSRKDRFDFVFLGDIHAGSASFKRDYFENQIDFLAESENYYVIGMGDYIENTPPDHHNFNWDHVDRELLTTEDQHRYVTEQFKKLDGKIIGLIEGEHDLRTEPMTGHSWTRRTCFELNVPYLGLSSLFRIVFQRVNERRSWDFYIYHGRYGGRKVGGAINKVIETGAYWRADIVAMGGTHILDAHVGQWNYLNKLNHLEKGKRIYLLTGSYLESYQEDIDSYAEPANYPPLRIGSPKVKIYPSEGDIHVSQ